MQTGLCILSASEFSGLFDNLLLFLGLVEPYSFTYRERLSRNTVNDFKSVSLQHFKACS